MAIKHKPPLGRNYSPTDTPYFGPDDVAEIDYQKGSFRFVCCDCGLAHLLSFDVTSGRIYMMTQRDEAATRAERAFRRIQSSFKRKEAEAQAGEGGSSGTSK